jgi:hypothetical protein
VCKEGRIATRLAPKKGLKRRPFLGLIPASPSPPAFLPIRTRAPTCALALGSRGCAVADGWGAFALSIGMPARLPSLSQSNSAPIFARLRAPRQTHELLLLPTFQQTCQTKQNSLSRRFSGTAFGWSSFLTFASRQSLQLRSAPTVNPACAVLRGAYPPKPRCAHFRALRLRSEIDSASLRFFHPIANCETNVFTGLKRPNFSHFRLIQNVRALANVAQRRSA